MASSRGRWANPERTVVWTEPPPKTISTSTRRHGAPPTKVAVVYYLSRNGQLDHPHFMEVTLSSPQDGLCLRDVLDRLNVLRGTGMADAYSWSSKRSYRNGYVWHDLTADDPVHPANGNEYVLKGSELLRLPQLPVRPRDGSASSSSSTSSCEPSKNRLPSASGRAARRKNWSSFERVQSRCGHADRRGGRGHADRRNSTWPAAECGPGPRAAGGEYGDRDRRDIAAAVVQQPGHAGDAHRARRPPCRRKQNGRGARARRRREARGGRGRDLGRADARVGGADAAHLLRLHPCARQAAAPARAVGSEQQHGHGHGHGRLLGELIRRRRGHGAGVLQREPGVLV